MLAGEYAVVHGGPALMMAVDRLAIAQSDDGAHSSGPFLATLARILSERFGPESTAAHTARHCRVDTAAFRHQGQKLGLGSSAAATVAATALALAAEAGTPDRALVHELAERAHGDAQEAQGARGSGADIAACVHGGVLLFQREADGHRVEPLIDHPSDLHLAFPWTMAPASTTELVAAVQHWGRRHEDCYHELLAGIQASARTMKTALDTGSPPALVSAVADAATALRALGEASGTPLWLPIHDELARLADTHHGALKTSGAGGGDLALAAFESGSEAVAFRNAVQARGIPCPELCVDTEGVRLLP
jgi:phosphomevalonate kinase